MIGANCLLYMLMLVDPRQSIMYSGSLIITAGIYFFASVISTLVGQGFDNIGEALYQSKWYLLAVKERKMFLMVLMMSQKSKAIEVGPFANSSLERYTDVSLSL